MAMAVQWTEDRRSKDTGTHKWRTKGRKMGQEQEADNRILVGGAVAAQQTMKGRRKGNMHTKIGGQGRGGRGSKPTPDARFEGALAALHTKQSRREVAVVCTLRTEGSGTVAASSPRMKDGRGSGSTAEHGGQEGGARGMHTKNAMHRVGGRWK